MATRTIKCMVKECEYDGNYPGAVQIIPGVELELCLCRDHHRKLVEDEEENMSEALITAQLLAPYSRLGEFTLRSGR